MPVTVIRLYESQAAAEGAWTELRRQRFSSSDVHLIHAPADGADPTPLIMEAGVSRQRAQRYSERLRHGGALVVVHPPFGYAELAEQVLDEKNPIASFVPDRDYDTGADFESDATPFSRALGWKVLSRHNPSPFSDAIGWSTLSKPHARTYPATIPIRQLGGSAAPFSRLFGLPVLTHLGAALFAGRDVDRLSANPAPLSNLLRLKTLLRKQTILGGTLLNSAAPFSRALGLPVLTKNQR